jgi:hypothetical protein
MKKQLIGLCIFMVQAFCARAQAPDTATYEGKELSKAKIAYKRFRFNSLQISGPTAALSASL